MVQFLLFVAMAQQSADSSALGLLQHAAKELSDAHSYHLVVARRSQESGSHHGSWEEQSLVAVVDGSRYHYEGISDMGSAIKVSDGRTATTYHLHEKLYKQSAAAASTAGPFIGQEESVLYEAQHLIEELSHRFAGLNSATELPDTTAEVNGMLIPCHIIRFSQADAKTRDPDEKIRETFWIDKRTGHLIRSERESDSYMVLPGSETRIPSHQVVTDSYTYSLNQPEPDSSFRFTAAADARLVSEFPEVLLYEARKQGRDYDPHADEFLNKPAPDVSLPEPGGANLTLSSLRGKPVFLEFWASSCAPCVAAMPQLIDLHRQAISTGIKWFSIDVDEIPESATKLLADKHADWPNYHDGDGTISKAFARVGVPLGVLLDADGKVVFYQFGFQVNELRKAIARLGPEYAKFLPPQ